MIQITQRAESMLQTKHSSSAAFRAVADNVSLVWQQLVFHAEERQKLVMASTNWYKTAEQVMGQFTNYLLLCHHCWQYEKFTLSYFVHFVLLIGSILYCGVFDDYFKIYVWFLNTWYSKQGHAPCNIRWLHKASFCVSQI